MPTKSSKSKASSKNEKSQPKRKLTGAQIAFGIFALLLILSMVLALVRQTL